MLNKTRHKTNDVYDTMQHSLASLLTNRGHSLAAAVVAMSRYRCDRVDNLDGGQYETTLEVPAEADDTARGELLDDLDQGCRDMIGHDYHAGLRIRVLPPPANPDWAAQRIEELRAHRARSPRPEGQAATDDSNAELLPTQRRRNSPPGSDDRGSPAHGARLR